MYNAFESYEGDGGKGSTKLHMDMADAVNILMHASMHDDGSPAYALWNIFRAGDAEAIREFLIENYPECSDSDPIHSQNYFLDNSLRRRLWEEKCVKSYWIHQKPGDAVFILAGCTHQVCTTILKVTASQTLVT